MEQNMKKKRPLIVLTGPTAVGKTALSIQLAQAVGGEIISADSMQVYRHMDIGTAKIKPEEMKGIPHYLVDCLEPEDPFNVVIFQRMAKAAVEQIYSHGNIPIIAGGTGFYIQSVLYDIDFDAPDSTACGRGGGIETASEEAASTQRRLQLYELARRGGPQVLHDCLKAVDPESAARIHPNNIKRVARAVEFYEQNKVPISRHNKQQQHKKSPYRFLYFVLNDDRSRLYERIDARVDEMFARGLVQEVSRLIARGADREMVSMQGIGYKELFGYFAGEYDLERARDLIKQDTRHFAKRQITWFKREKNVIWMNYPEYGYSELAVLEAMLGQIYRELLD